MVAVVKDKDGVANGDGAARSAPKYDSASLFTRFIPPNDNGLVGHVNFLLVFGVTFWHAIGPSILPAAARPSSAMGGRLFDLTIPRSGDSTELWTLGAAWHLLLSNLGVSMNVAMMIVGAVDCREPGDARFIQRKVFPLLLIVLAVHALGTSLVRRGPLGSLCGPRCKAGVQGVTIETWFLNELLLLRMLRVCATVLRASAIRFAIAAVLFFLLHSSGYLMHRANRYVGLFEVKRGGSFRISPPFGAPFYDPDLGWLAYALAPFIIRKDLTFVPWPSPRVVRTSRGPIVALALWVLLPGWLAISITYFARSATIRDGWGQCSRRDGRLPVGSVGAAGDAAKACCSAFARDLLSGASPQRGARLVAHYFHHEAFALLLALVLLVTLGVARQCGTPMPRRAALVLGILVASAGFFVDVDVGLLSFGFDTVLHRTNMWRCLFNTAGESRPLARPLPSLACTPSAASRLCPQVLQG